MHPKHIKNVLLLLLVFVARYSLAAATTVPVQRSTLYSEITGPARPLPDDNEQITGILIQSQVCEVEPQYEPVKTAAYSPSNLQCYGTLVNTFPVVRYAYAPVSDHYSRLCRLILFPCHGFW